MIEMYRLAVIRSERGDVVAIERAGRLAPLAEMLTSEDLAKLGGEPTDLAPLLADWRFWKSRLEDRANTRGEEILTKGVSSAAVSFRPLLTTPPNLICIGSNYHDHIAEMKIPMTPSYPYSFLKPSKNTLRGSGEPVAVPKGVHMMDWEAELAVVIGATASHVEAADALDYVAGYANFNDLSARDWLASRPPVGIDWVRHKAFDGFAPFGPYFVPAQFVPDPQNLAVRLWVNGEARQDSSTEQMVFGVAAIIAHLTSIMTLEPGDVIATGTPAGVGHGREPQQFLKAGDEVRIEIGPLGELVTPIV